MVRGLHSARTWTGACAGAGCDTGALGRRQGIGQVTGLTGSTLQLTLRTGRIIVINLRAALASHLVPRIVKGEFLMVQGKPEGAGRMDALAIVRAKSAPVAWPPDIL